MASSSQWRSDMFRSLDIAATGMASQETKLDVVANNLANANTTAYKRQDAEFEDLLYQNVRGPAMTATGVPQPVGTQVGTGARVVATTRAFAQGQLLQTDNPLDVAIEGNGFIPVMQPDGEVAYTRTGTLKLDAQGKIVTSDGLPIEPAINIPINATQVNIGADGQVAVIQPGSPQPNVVGQLQLAVFPNQGGLQALGHNLYAPTGASGDAMLGQPGKDGRGTILQGSLESSNVQVVDEMIGLIRSQRAYEINSKVVQAADEMLRNATNLR